MSGDSGAETAYGPPARRRSGLFELPAVAGLSDHACFGYRSEAERAELATSWLADGLRLRQRALYVADGPIEELRGDVAGLRDLAGLPAARALAVCQSGDVYDLSLPIDAPSQLAAYAAIVEQAIADGFRGVRVAADITPLVADPARRDAHVSWEQRADRYITDHPFAPLCLYDARTIGGIDAIVCSHPLHGPKAPGFALYAGGPTRATLEGEVDVLAGATLDELLRHLPETDESIDVSALAFADGHAAWRLHDELVRRRRAGQELTLLGASPVVRRVWEVCGLDGSFLAG